MEETNTENLDSSTEELENTNSSNSEEVTADAPEQEAGETKAEFTEREKQYYARIKKLEGELKEAKKTKTEKTVDTGNLSQTDLLALAKLDIHEDDLDDVIKWAKNDGVSVREAYTSYKPMLDTRSQQRQTAQATEVKSARGKKPETNEAIIEKASSGDLKPTEENIAALVKARHQARLQKAKR
jgi:hypothetical protein